MRNMHWFEVIDTRGLVEAKIAHWHVTMKFSFTLSAVMASRYATRTSGSRSSAIATASSRS